LEKDRLSLSNTLERIWVMIGNKFLYDLYKINDLDTSLNQLMESLKSKDENFIDSLNTPVDSEVCDEDEIIYLTKASALIDYYSFQEVIKRGNNNQKSKAGGSGRYSGV